MIDLTFLFNCLGWLLIFMPVCLSQNTDKQCFSQSLIPSYPCCKGDKVIYTDKDGDWGVENGKWCGIGNGLSNASDDSCFSVALGYKCCEKCKVVYTDDDGEWGVENNKWCGIKDSCASPVETGNTVTVQDSSDFDFSFLKMENNKQNMLYSPLSIKYALKMLEEGALGNTLDEISKVVGNSTLTKYESIGKALSLANSLFIKDTYYKNVKTEYIDTLQEKYDAEIIKDEFKDAKNANQWIEDKTLGIIKDMLEDKAVQNAVMLLANALAIDMEWVSNFSLKNTGGQMFFLEDGEEMEATTMYQKFYSNNLSYAIDEDKTVVTMNLINYDAYDIQFEFMAIMPNSTLSTFVENVSKKQIQEIDEKLTPATEVIDGVILRIPKFKFDYDLNLKDDLKNLGIKDAFDADNANFTNMANIQNIEENLYVSDALHKAVIEFSEEGIKAAAVTVIILTTGAAVPRPTNPVVININKPFMFIIRDKITKDIWFTGTVYKPNDWAIDEEIYKLARNAKH